MLLLMFVHFLYLILKRKHKALIYTTKTFNLQ